MSAIPFYLDPRLARENLIASRLLNAARRAAKLQEQRRKQLREQAFGQLLRVGWSEEAAAEMADSYALSKGGEL